MTGIFEDVASILDSLGVVYALIGGRAVVLRGYRRVTFDYDFFTADRRVLDRSIWQRLEDKGAHVDARKGDQFDPVAGVVHITMPDGEDADVVLAKWKWELGVLARAEPLSLRGLRVPVPITSDLILLKLAAGGSRDLHDIQELLARNDPAAIIPEVEAHIGEVHPDVRQTWKDLLASR